MKFKRLAAAAAALAMTASMTVPLNVSAENYKIEDQAQGGTWNFDKYLVLDKDAAVPNVTTKFSIAAGEALPDPVNGVTCYAGIGTPVFSADEAQEVTLEGDKAVVAFDSNDTTTPEKSANTKTVIFKTTEDDTDEKFAAKTLTVSFAGITFPEPGLYRYIITEEAPTDGGISIPAGHSTEYTLFVTIKDENGKLVVANTEYVLQEGTAAPTIVDKDVLNENNEVTGSTRVNANKKTGFTNWYTTHDLMFNKLVQGNQGSRDKYFKFTVKLTNPEGDGALTMTEARNNDRFIVKGTYDTNPANNNATKAEYKAAAEGSEDSVMKVANRGELQSMSLSGETVSYITYEQLAAGKDFYLHSGQNIEIYGIPEGLGYEVSEVKEDYTAVVALHSAEGYDSDGAASDENTKVTDASLTNTARLTFTNTKGGTIPTGLITTVAASAAVLVIGAAGVAGGMIYLKKKKDNEEE